MARAVHATGGSFIRHRPPRVRGVGGIALPVGVIRADSGGRPLTTKLLTAQVTPPAVSRPRPAQPESGAENWRFVVVNRRNDFRDQPLHGADRLTVVEVPRTDQPLIGGWAPQQVKQSGQRSPLRIRQLWCAGGHRVVQGVVPSGVGAGESRAA
jgi:hypothetical protein